MFCAISGKPPVKAVLSPNSKCIFEQHLLEQYIDQNGTDPITNDALKKSDLIEINTTPHQLSLSETLDSATIANNYSIPSLLNTLQKEWDAVMLENFELRKQLDSCKKSLSDALYRYDAVAATAAKAFVERDQLRQELTELTSSLSVVENEEKSSESLLSEFSKEISTNSQHYITSFKKSKRKLQHFNHMQTKDAVEFTGSIVVNKNWHVDISQRSMVVKDNEKAYVFGLKDSEIEVNPNIEYLVEYNGKLYGFIDNHLIRYDIESRNMVGDDLIEGIQTPVIFLGFPEHITEAYFIFVSSNGMVYGYSTHKKELFTIKELELENHVEFVSYHKDGGLLAVGNETSGVIVLNLLAPDSNPIKFPVSFAVTKVEFGLNGYWMFVFGKSELCVFDLRKEVGTLAMDPISFDEPISTVEIDDTGKGLFVNTIDGKIRWFEHVKGQSFVEKSILSIESGSLKEMVLLKTIENDNYLLKALSDNKCITYELSSIK